MSETERDLRHAGTIENGRHRFEARIYYADTDFSGVVYHARYLELLERGRSDMLRHVGIIHSQLAEHGEAGKTSWIVRRMEIDFRGGARIDDLLTIETAMTTLSGARLVMAQTIRLDGAPIVDAVVHAATIDAAGRPKRFPRVWLDAFRAIGIGPG